ncbi:uncharacterized protein LOC132915958 [Bombus pascuorum]|uniref:uncharacterized protein LOC132915700 n=1 Tax=Bombus pascuorum TaxID=65598 RepID=UPI00298DE41B|nr:uncharacterized protein LOC132915700 [Bombus pascuorum]XP_060831509.1 uncharacterized protein LOC132915701 [Bombus pascuorum]XP_060831704.1 uncharacterized protein LOC132915958 [Bombus pascuorum]
MMILTFTCRDDISDLSNSQEIFVSSSRHNSSTVRRATELLVALESGGEQELPRSHWWSRLCNMSASRRYFLLLMLESFIGLITLVFTVLLTPYKSFGQSLQMCADGVASLTGLAGIVDALMTPRNRFSGFTMAFLVFDLAAFGLSFTSLSVIVVRISTNVGMPLDGDKSNSIRIVVCTFTEMIDLLVNRTVQTSVPRNQCA